MEILDYKPEDTVKSCPLLERGLSFEPWGLHFCCESTVLSPAIFSSKEIREGKATYESIRDKRIEIFKALNEKNPKAGSCLNCGSVVKKKFKDVSFDYLGGGLTLNIQHFTNCNMRCKYCSFTKENNFKNPEYSTDDMLAIFNDYRDRGKSLNDCWITANGGEPTLLKGYGEFCAELDRLGFGSVCIFSNCTKYDSTIAELLGTDRIYSTFSIDAGVPTTFAEVRGVSQKNMYKVVDTLVKYRKTGTHRLWLKYIITEDNCNEDDLFSFVFLMISLRPDKVYICPEFPYGDFEHPYKYVTFGAKMWYLLEKYGNINIHIQTDDNKADPKFAKYSRQIREEFAKLVAEHPLSDEFLLYDAKKKCGPETEALLNEVTAKNQCLMVQNEALEQKVLCKELQRLKAFATNEKTNSLQKAINAMYQRLSASKFMENFILRSGAFDEEFYLSQLSGCSVNSHFDALQHYCYIGWKEGKNPVAWFDTNRYLAINTDVTVNPFYHFLRFGILEGRAYK